MSAARLRGLRLGDDTSDDSDIEDVTPVGGRPRPPPVATASDAGELDLFASPLASTSSSVNTGGTRGDKVVTCFYSGENPAQWCGGKIANSEEKFCCRRKENCSTKTHIRNKVEVSATLRLL